MPSDAFQSILLLRQKQSAFYLFPNISAKKVISKKKQNICCAILCLMSNTPNRWANMWSGRWLDRSNRHLPPTTTRLIWKNRFCISNLLCHFDPAVKPGTGLEEPTGPFSATRKVRGKIKPNIFFNKKETKSQIVKYHIPFLIYISFYFIGQS